MISVSDITGKTYENESAVFFRNYIQSAFYIANGAILLDLFTDSNMKLVFVFSRADHERLIHKWMENKEQRFGSDQSEE